MFDTKISQSNFTALSAKELIDRFESDPMTFKNLESDEIVRKLFGIEPAQPGSLDITLGMEQTLDLIDQYKIRDVMTDPGISGIIWRFITDKKFMVELSKTWVQKSNVLTLTLVTVNEETEKEPASLEYRTLVTIGQYGPVFNDKSDITTKYEFSISDMLLNLYFKSHDDKQKEVVIIEKEVAPQPAPKEAPKASKFEFVCTTEGYGHEIIAGLTDLECDLPITMSVNDIVMMTNGIFHSKAIKDYRATGAKLIGSTDLDDYTSERTWKIFFEMTPEALETEKAHQIYIEKRDNTVKILEGTEVTFSRSNTPDEIIISNAESGIEITRFSDSVVIGLRIFGLSHWKAKCDITYKMLHASNFHFEDRFSLVEQSVTPESPASDPVETPDNTVCVKKDDVVLFRRSPTEDEVVIFRYHDGKELSRFVDADIASLDIFNKSWKAECDITYKMLHTSNFRITKNTILTKTSNILEWFKPVDEEAPAAIESETTTEPEKKEADQVKYNIKVCDALANCSESLIQMLNSILSEIPNGHDIDEKDITRKLIELTEIDVLEVEYLDGTWVINQIDPVDTPEEVESANIHDQNVQLGLLRGIFGVADPAITHVHKFLRKHLTDTHNEGYTQTETFPTETMIVWDTKPYDFAFSIVKFKDGRFYRLYLAYNNPAFTDQSWLATNHVPGRWVRVGRDIQNSCDFKPSFQGRHNPRFNR